MPPWRFMEPPWGKAVVGAGWIKHRCGNRLWDEADLDSWLPLTGVRVRVASAINKLISSWQLPSSLLPLSGSVDILAEMNEEWQGLPGGKD